jgi:hypothetical protein
MNHTKLTGGIGLRAVAVLVLLLGWQCELKAHDHPFSLANCQQAQILQNQPRRTPGDLTRSFIGCFNDLLIAGDILGVDANSNRLEAVGPFLHVYEELVPATITLLRQLIDQASRKQIRDFEERIISSELIDEAIAFGAFLNAPLQFVSTTEKFATVPILGDSIKTGFNSLFDSLTKDPALKKVVEVVRSSFVVLDEVFDLIK